MAEVPAAREARPPRKNPRPKKLLRPVSAVNASVRIARAGELVAGEATGADVIAVSGGNVPSESAASGLNVPREETVADESVEEFAAEYIQEDSVDRELSVPTESIERTADDRDAEGRPRRRRRRGGRRSRRTRDRREGAESREPVEGSEDEARDEVFADLDARDDQPLVPPELDVDPLAGIDTFDDEDDDQGQLSAEDGTASRELDEESGERRGRRRRRRRRGRSRKESPEAAESEGESGDNVAGGWGSPTTSAEDRVTDADALEGDDEGDEEFVGSSDKNSHRAIPTWDEAIGYIIAVNMDSRAKNPNSRSGAPRGGRGRRGGRSGPRSGGGHRSN